MEQEDYRGGLGACFAMEDSDPAGESRVHVGLAAHFAMSGQYAAVVVLFVLLPGDTGALFLPTLP